MENYNWERYQKYLFKDESLGLSLDYSCFAFSSKYFAEMENKIKKAPGTNARIGKWGLG